jgi:Uncharacterized protein conserved in bacteria
MSGFGERMRREREMRGVSLEEISDSTKIGTRSLKAIEDNEFQKLPGGIFNKGFVRAYAKFLGLDQDETVADFDAAWKEHQLATGQSIELALPVEEPPQEPARAPWALLISALVLLAAIVGLGWFFVVKNHSAGTTNSPAAAKTALQPSNVQRVDTQPTSASNAGVLTDSRESPQLTSQSKSNRDSSPDTGKSKPSAHDGKAETALPSDSSPPGAIAVQSVASPIQLKVVAHENSWYSLSADGKDLGQGFLSADKSRNVHAQKEVRLKLGNAGGVDISFNGKPVNLDGEPNQVRELTFTPQGLHQ